MRPNGVSRSGGEEEIHVTRAHPKMKGGKEEEEEEEEEDEDEEVYQENYE